jgi:putative endonuclease
MVWFVKLENPKKFAGTEARYNRGMEAYSIYILHCSDDTYYTGLTTDLKRRVREHVSGKHHRAYTYSRRPVRLVWHEVVEGKEVAMAREKQVKAMSPRRKERLIESYHAD